MVERGKRSGWGGVRKLPSGRFQAHYRVEGIWHKAPNTFLTKRDADIFLANTRAEMERGTWIDPETGQITFADYSERWLRERPTLRPRTRDLYATLLRLHVLPELGSVDLNKLSPSRVRGWHAKLVAAGNPGASTVAKSYRLLHTIMQTAVQDEVVLSNPCVLRGAGAERPVERPVATVPQVFALADAIEPRYKAMVLLATFTGLRLGELVALRRRNLDLLHKQVQVVEAYQELADGTMILGDPTTDAGRRKVAIPDAIVPDLESHLAEYAIRGRDGLVFPDSRDQPLRRRSFQRIWTKAAGVVGLEGLHFHDLRHTGNTLAAATGASTKELMSRMGHASPRAALIYQHATKDRDAAIAAALSDVISKAQPADSGAPVAKIGARGRNE